MTNFDHDLFRQCFPALTQTGVYLDSAAATLKPNALIQSTHNYYSNNGNSVHRSLHQNAELTTLHFEQTRALIAQRINAISEDEIVWTRGTTEGINLVAQSYARPRLTLGDEIIVCESEHHSNMIPWFIVAEQTGAKIVKLPLTEAWLPDIDALRQYLNPRTKLLAIGHMSNVTGGTADLQNAIAMAHQHHVTVVVDGAQGVVHHPVDVQALNADFYLFSTHKWYGPTGLGVLYGKKSLLEKMPPWHGGGKMLTEAAFSQFTPQLPPHRFEAGTPNIAGVLGFKATLEWFNEFDYHEAEQYSCQLAEHAVERLSTLPGFTHYRSGQSSLLAFNITGYHHDDLALLLAEQNIALRSGQHCAQPLIEILGVSGTLRASFAPYNRVDEIEKLYEGLKYAMALLNE